MNAQDGLYSVLELSPEGSSISVPGVHTGAIVAAHDPAAVVNAIAASDTRIVSMTVTEHGYCMDRGALTARPRSRRHRRGSARRGAGHRDRPARACLGTKGFRPPAADHRAQLRQHARNGHQTRGLILEFLAAAQLSVDDWVAGEVSFPNSMVDRIVPATTDLHDGGDELLGVRDATPGPGRTVHDVGGGGQVRRRTAGVGTAAQSLPTKSSL